MTKQFIHHVCFPFTFDVVRLKSDLERVLSENWVNHYNQGAYSGNWTSVALLTAGGASTSINANPLEKLPVLETPIMQGCDYFREVVQYFQFEIITARLLCLEVGAEIKPHRDHCLGYEDGEFRLHIPIVTNPDVEFLLAGERIIMDEGSCWYINANEVHSVANRGTENRIHLVIDGIRNDWSDELFFSQATKEQFERPAKELSVDEKQRVIAELELLGTPAAKLLIEQMKAS